ncbi:protein FAM162A isoform X1 [Desmodus rotundus]|uniref:protein FAM162A isoform X1 n=1 Tax=Desmodus rotundus TaxID=9430 RepID=UPI001E1BEB39|nr:protein FAM162A isoform X1 [Desmodus rotundus]
MGSLRGLHLVAGNYFRLCERDAFSFLRLTRNSDLKRMNRFCTKPQESPKAPSHLLDESTQRWEWRRHIPCASMDTVTELLDTAGHNILGCVCAQARSSYNLHIHTCLWDTYRHRVPLHKPTDWERKILIWSGRFKKEDEIPETVSFDMLHAAKNKVRVKISYVMMALTVAGCILMVIEGKKAAKRHESLTSLNLEKKARLREEAAMKAKTE